MHKTRPELQAMTAEEIQREHKSARQYEQKVRKVIQERRKSNTPPGFIPKDFE